MQELKTIIGDVAILVAVVLLSAALAIAGNSGGTLVNPWADFQLGLILWGAILVFVLQWLAYVPAYLLKTERFYDLLGGGSFLFLMLLAVVVVEQWDARKLVLVSMVSVWALRLTAFLVVRIVKDGKDVRFEKIKRNPMSFLIAWTVQGAWVVITSCCALAAISALQAKALVWHDYLAIALWVTGFAIESLADWQKRQFKRKPQSDTPFIRSGLWAWSRHPNYFGEILLWFAVALLAFPVLSDWQYLTLLSPLFVWILLRHISGVPPLEAKADERWHDREDYQHYKQTTPILLPRFPRR